MLEVSIDPLHFALLLVTSSGMIELLPSFQCRQLICFWTENVRQLKASSIGMIRL